LCDKQGAAVSLNAMAVLARDQGDVAVANSLFEESLVLWRELGDQKAVARSLSNLANVVKLQGDYPRAGSLYAECLFIFRGLGDRTGIAWSLNYQGDVARDQGDSAAARKLYEEGLTIFGNSVTAGASPARWLIWEAWQENSEIAPQQTLCTGKA